MDPVSVYNPSVIQYHPEEDDEDEAEIARQEAEEQLEIEMGVSLMIQFFYQNNSY